ncbi:MAG TPA: hypothetical protein VGF28_05980 [Thermoanaerobaculia bacterium]
MKKLTVAAAMVLIAATASASNFRGADQVYVPIAGHVQGATGTFVTDVYISNLSSDPVSVSVIFQERRPDLPPDGTVGREFANAITLRPFERKQYLDFFVSALNINTAVVGQLIFNGCRQNQNCGPETQDINGVSPHFRPISVETRTYQVLPSRPGETTGQLLSGYPWYSFVSQRQSNVDLDEVFITGITFTGGPGQLGTYRTNLGFVNASQYSSTTIVARLYKETLDTFVQEARIRLSPLGNVSGGLDGWFPGVAQGSNYFVIVSQTETTPFGTPPAGCEDGCPAFITYGSVLDNVSGDATTLEAQYLRELDSDAIDEIFPLQSGKRSVRRSVRSR